MRVERSGAWQSVDVDCIRDEIASCLAMTADTQVLEQEIDAMVYELYGLSAEEIAIVDGPQS